jgi:hypothetical protein
VTRHWGSVGFALIVSLTIVTNIAWAEKFRHLSAAEIRALMIGKRITDDGHWSQTLERSGRLLVNDLGRPSFGSWSIKDNWLCIPRPEVIDACYDVWLSGDQIQLHVPGKEDALTAFPRFAVAEWPGDIRISHILT